MWTIYLLYHPYYNRTYIGITTNLQRRLRQHNCEIQGGAKSTKKFSPGWTIYCTLQGLEGRSTAMRWEKLLKLRARGLNAREQAFCDLSKGICPSPGKYYEPPTNLVYEEYNGS